MSSPSRLPVSAAALPSFWRVAWVVYCKELLDSLRDRRTLGVVLVSSVLIGPLVLVALSAFVAALETRAQTRRVYIDGAQHAPALVNFLQRQSFSVEAAPAGFEAQLRNASLGDPVLVVPPGFEATPGQERSRPSSAAALEIVSDSGNKRADAGAARLQQLLQAYAHERSTLALALRGISPSVAAPLTVHERDLGGTQGRAAQVTGLLPFFVIIAVLYGALHAALDSTAGERERGSLEPLQAHPLPPVSLVAGKWAAVATLSMGIALLSCLSFLPAQWFLRSGSLAALLHFGWREAAWFLALLLPLAAALSAVLMAVAIRCRSFKEAQANSTVVVLAVSLLPLVTVFTQGSPAPWHAWVPALAQHNSMIQVLKGDAFSPAQVLLPLAVCLLLTALALAYVARRMRSAMA